MNKHIFGDVAVWLAAGTGALYILGNTYYISWLQTLGLSSSFLPKDTPQLLQMGFAPFYTYGLWAIALLVPTLWLLSLFTKLLFKLVVLTVRKLMPDFYSEVVNAWNSEVSTSEPVKNKKGSGFSETLDFAINNLMFLFLLALVYGCLGSWRAFDKIQDIDNKKEIVYQLEGVEMSILTCSSVTSLCAVYNYDDHQTEIIKMESLASSVVVSKPEGVYERLFLKSTDEKI
ncbi:hypothetical protein [Vibrio aestuarianus]|uniref:hypothetical protein n=1 Tax=Vibrio aestuarianus TaxID=28171 RepID=UPI001D635AAE|nr:hypothetical protein [Vibrio aestuarianus]EJG1834099.1 hypothetical protein [Vibrio parahaemolyticus]MDE1266279.1 hypothetical protein [Vibrio aestuarianus]MDE1298422.1 hypothetical protein [Vibrio aestuarianus]